MHRRLVSSYGWIVAVLLICLAITGSQLLFKPLVGVADNGDFKRLMCTGLFAFQQDPGQHRYFDYFYHTYWLDPTYGLITYWSSQIALLGVAKWISMKIWNYKNNTVYFFDIRVLAVTTLAVLMAAFAIGLAAIARRSYAERFLASLFVLLCFCDIGYIQYFNSFFSEPSSFVWLMMSISSCLYYILVQPSGLLRYVTFVFILLAMICFVTAKAQNVPIAIPFSFLLFRFGRSTAQSRHGWVPSLILPLMLLLVSCVYFIEGRDTEVKQANLYHHFFGELVPESEEPRAVLAEFGLPATYESLSRTNWFSPGIPKNDPAFVQQFYSHVSLAGLVGFYLRHPQRMYRLALRKSRYAFEMRTYLGNFEPESGRPPRAQSQRFASWSRFKHWLVGRTEGPKGSYLLFAVLLFQTMLVLYKRFRWDRDQQDRLLSDLHGSLVFSAALAFMAIVVGEGHTDEISRYMLVVNVLLDVCFGLTLGYGLAVLRTLTYPPIFHASVR